MNCAIRRYLTLFLAALLLICSEAVLLSGLDACAEADDENLLMNAAFEMLDENGIPEDWYKDAYVQEPGYTSFQIDPEEEQLDGLHILRIHNIALNDARLAQTVPVEPESLYCFSALVKAVDIQEGHGANLSIEGVYSFSEELFDTDGEWHRIVWYGETGSDQTTVTVFIRLGGYSGESLGTAYFADLHLTAVDSLPDDVIASRWFKLETPAVYSDEEDETVASPAWPVLIAVSMLYLLMGFCILSFISENRPSSVLSGENKGSIWILSAGFLIAISVRLILSSLIEGYQVDVNCFLSWGSTILEAGPARFYETVSFCDYPPAYLYILGLNAWLCQITGASAGFSRIIFRLLPSLCDVFSSLVLYRFLSEREGQKLANRSIPVLLLFALNPVTIINSAAWGQMDSILCFLLLLVALWAVQGKWLFALPCYMLAVLVKPQALMLGFLGLAAMIFTWLSDPSSRKKILLGLLASLCIAASVIIPFGVHQSPGWLISLYADTLGSYPYATVNTANLYYLLGANWQTISHSAPWFACLILGLCYAGFAVLWYCKAGKRFPAFRTEGILSFLFCGWMLYCALSGADWTQTGVSAMVFAFVIVFSLYLRKKDIRFLPFCGALLFLLLYCFGIKMHERYIFPAFFLLLLSWCILKDRRILIALLLSSATVFLNEGIVLDNSVRLGSAMGHLNRDTVALADIISILNILCSMYAVWTGVALCLGETESQLLPFSSRIPIRNVPEGWIRDSASGASLRWKKLDTWLLLGMTTVYSVLSLCTLGSMKAPQTAWSSSGYDEAVIFDLGEAYQDVTVLYFGQVSRYDFTFAQSNDCVNWSSEVYAQMDQGQCWKWKYVTSSSEKTDGSRSFQNIGMEHVLRFSCRYIRLTAHQVGLKLNEVLFRTADGIVLPVIDVGHVGGNMDSELYSTPETLVDEQNTLEALPQYFADAGDEATVHFAQPSWWNSTYFDEIYHARTAFEFLQGTVPYETTHPPLGKVLMSWGVALFGMTPFGWRFAGAVAGILMLPGMYLLAKQLTKRTSFAALACALMALDCQHLTQTQIATIDSFPVLFIIFAFFFMLRFLQSDPLRQPVRSVLPALCFSGLFMGLAIASKWIGIYAGAGLAVLYFWKCGSLICTVNRQPKEKQHFVFRRIACISLWCLLFFVIIPILIYLISYLPYMAYNDSIHSIGEYVRAVWQAQINMFIYHSTDQRGMDHPFYSPWWQWPVIGKPMYYASESYRFSNGLCYSLFCFGNPVVWWGGLAALFMCFLFWLLDKRYVVGNRTEKWHIRPITGNHEFAFLFISLGAQYLPWMLVPRGTYIYHYFASVPFIILSIVLSFSTLAQRNWKTARIGMAVFLLLAFSAFILFFPYASGILVPQAWLDIGKKILRIWY